MSTVLKNRLFIAVVFTLFGALGMYLAQRTDFIRRSERPKFFETQSDDQLGSLLDQFYNDDFFGSSKDPFKEMRRMREHMAKEFGQPNLGGGFFDSWYGKRFGGGDVGEVKRHEDDRYIYYEIKIKDLNRENLKVKVVNRQINISGHLEKKTDEGKSVFTSSFHRSFPVPPEVDADQVQIDGDNDKIIVKFPKIEPKTKDQ